MTPSRRRALNSVGTKGLIRYCAPPIVRASRPISQSRLSADSLTPSGRSVDPLRQQAHTRAPSFALRTESFRRTGVFAGDLDIQPEPQCEGSRFCAVRWIQSSDCMRAIQRQVAESGSQSIFCDDRRHRGARQDRSDCARLSRSVRLSPERCVKTTDGAAFRFHWLHVRTPHPPQTDTALEYILRSADRAHRFKEGTVARLWYQHGLSVSDHPFRYQPTTTSNRRFGQSTLRQNNSIGSMTRPA